MLLDQVTTGEMQAAQILTGATMVAFIAAPWFGRHAVMLRIATLVLYILGIVGFIIYAVMSPAPG
jgi:hypothetical protein